MFGIGHRNSGFENIENDMPRVGNPQSRPFDRKRVTGKLLAVEEAVAVGVKVILVGIQ